MAETLYDVLQFKGEAGGKAIIDEVLGVCPEVTGTDKYNGGRSFPMDFGTEASDTMETLFMTSVPEVNPFRIANTGVTPSKGTYEKRLDDDVETLLAEMEKQIDTETTLTSGGSSTNSPESPV